MKLRLRIDCGTLTPSHGLRLHFASHLTMVGAQDAGNNSSVFPSVTGASQESCGTAGPLVRIGWQLYTLSGSSPIL